MDSPIITASWQAGVLSALSNLLAQLITCWRTETAWQINAVDLIQFVLFSVLVCPPNFIWQSWLEAQFPAYAEELAGKEKEALVDKSVTGGEVNDVDGHPDLKSSKRKSLTKDSTRKGSNRTQPKLNKKNTAIKFSLDQTVGAAVNTILFIAGMGLIRGQLWSVVMNDIHTQFWPMIWAGQKLWPVVSILSFTLIPLEYRMLVGNTAGLFWGIYLSLMASTEH